MATYTDEQKAEALKLYEEHGPREAARRTGTNKSTVTRWAKAAGLRTFHAQKAREAAEVIEAAGQERRAKVRARLLDEIHATIDRLQEPQVAFVGQQGKQVEFPKPPAQDHFALVKSVGTLIDKLRLEEGQVTERTEHMQSSDFDREVAELVEKMKHGEPSSNGVG
jgi:transposase-like protein